MDTAPAAEAHCRIAILDGSDPERQFVSCAIRPLGHATVEFSRMKELAKALTAGERFDLMLACLDGGSDAVSSTARFLRHLCGEGAALILLLRPEQLLEHGTIAADVATDFTLMPCEDCELVARVLRIVGVPDAKGEARTPVAPTALRFGRYLFQPQGRTLHVDAMRLQLQPRQFDLALFLFRHANQTCSRAQIVRSVWGRDQPLAQSRTVDVHVTRLRKLLATVSAGDVSLLAIRGFGYHLLMEAAA